MRVKRQNRIHNLKGAISYPITKDASAFASIKKNCPCLAFRSCALVTRNTKLCKTFCIFVHLKNRINHRSISTSPDQNCTGSKRRQTNLFDEEDTALTVTPILYHPRRETRRRAFIFFFFPNRIGFLNPTSGF